MLDCFHIFSIVAAPPFPVCQ